MLVVTFLGHRDVAEMLLRYNANRECRTKTGITPLFQVNVCILFSYILGVLNIFNVTKLVDVPWAVCGLSMANYKIEV